MGPHPRTVAIRIMVIALGPLYMPIVPLFGVGALPTSLGFCFCVYGYICAYSSAAPAALWSSASYSRIQA